jgi:hypothetical protein
MRNVRQQTLQRQTVLLNPGTSTIVSKVRWAVEIQKTSLDSRNLTDLLAGLGFRVLDGIDFPALTSEEMDGCATAADAFEPAKRVRSALKGPAQIDMNFQLGSVIDCSCDPPRRHAFLDGQHPETAGTR